MKLASKKIMDAINSFITNSIKYMPNLLHKYSNIKYRLVFVNTPMLFDTIWDKIAQNMPKETLEKVAMLDDDS